LVKIFESGRHTVHLSGQGFQVTGLDNAPTALKLTREWLQQEHLAADLILADMRRPLPFRNDSFKAVLSTQVIHHARLATVLATASEIQRVVCRGGIILISVPARREIAMDGEISYEIEPNTFVPTGGSEKGLPHHLFTIIPRGFLALNFLRHCLRSHLGRRGFSRRTGK
jgi:SAM-dependent methyltransferase